MSETYAPGEMTLRDRIRLQALLLSATGYGWTINNLIQSDETLDDSNRQTIRRTLRSMTTQGLLTHPNESPYYRAGPLLNDIAKELLGETTHLHEVVNRKSGTAREGPDPDVG